MSDDLVMRLRVSAAWEDVHDAADLIEAQAAEITRLRATLTNARREGMEEAAKIAENYPDLKGAELLKRFSQVTVARGTNIFTKREIAAAIRAAAKEGKP